jgi:hypothetical protein
MDRQAFHGGFSCDRPISFLSERQVAEIEMNTWFSKSLGDAIYGGDEILAKVHADVQQMFAGAGDPPNMAVFTRLESEGRLHCELVVYFSPAAREAADIFGADPCEKPVRAGLELFAGNSACWPVLFPESG